MCRATPHSFAAPPGDDASSGRGDAASPAAPSDSTSVPVRLLGRLTLVLLLDALALLALSAILSGFTLSGPLAALGLAVVLGVANAVVWPLLAALRAAVHGADARPRRAGPQRGAAAGAAWLLDDVHVDGLFEAVVVTLGLTLITTLVGGVLALDRGDLWYRHVVRRQAKRAQAGREDRRARASSSSRSTGSPTTSCAARCATATRPCSRAGCTTAATASSAGRPTGPRRPAPARRACCTAPTTTCPRSAGGRRTPGRAIVTNHPRDAAEIERRRSNGRGLLYADGASRANILSGDAPHSMLTMSTVLDRNRQGRLGQDYFAYFASPYGVARTLLRVIGEFFIERFSAVQQVRRDVRPRIKRDWKYALVRSYATVIQLDLQVAAVTADVLAGRPVIYTTFLAYDEVAHHSGIERPDTLAVLRKVDQAIDRIAAAVEHAPRPYGLVVLSDHGQSQGATFRQRYGEGLEDIVARFAAAARCAPRTAHSDEGLASFNAGVSEVATRDTPVGHAVRTAAGQAARRGRPTTSIPEVSVMASGNLGIISFPREPGRVTLEQIAERRPGLLDALRGAPRHRVRARALRAPRRGRARPDAASGCCATTRVEGDDPLAPVRPVRRRPRAPHRRLRALPGHRRQQHLLGRAGGGRGLRGARRLARRHGRRPGAPVRAAPGRPAVAGGAGRQLGGRAPDPARAGSWAARPATRRWSATPSPATRSSATRRARASPRASRAPARPCDARTRAAGSLQQRRVAAPEADREERAPVDRDRDPRLDQRDRPRRALGVEVARAERGAPAPDRDQRDVDRAAQRRACSSSRSVSPANQTSSIRKPSVSCSAMPGPGPPAPVMPGGNDADRRCRRPRASRPPGPRAPCRSGSRRASCVGAGRAARRSCPARRAAAATACRSGRGAGARAARRRPAPGCAGSATWRSRCATRWRSTGSVMQPRRRRLEQHGGVAEPRDLHPAPGEARSPRTCPDSRHVIWSAAGHDRQLRGHQLHR